MLLPVEQPYESAERESRRKSLREQLSYVQFDEEDGQKRLSYYWPLLKSIVLRSTDEELCAIYQMEEGIEIAGCSNFFND